MKTYFGQITVTSEHIDTTRNHAGLVGQSAMIVQVMVDTMASLDLGLDTLREKEKTSFVITTVKEMKFYRQLLLGDVLGVTVLVRVSSKHHLDFRITFRRDAYKEDTTYAHVVANLFCQYSGLQKIPDAMLEVIGAENIYVRD